MRERAQQSWPALSNDGVRSCRGRTLEVGIGEDDVRGLAAELERHALDRPGGALHHAAADLGRAGEADLGDVGMLDQTLADLGALADDDLDDAFRNARLEAELGQAQGRERRQLGGLQHGGVAARERGPELPARDVQREVPRDDQPDDAERLAKGQVDPAGDRDRLAVVLVDRAGVEVEDLATIATSPRAPEIGLPTFRDSIAASSSARSSTSVASRRSSLARSCGRRPARRGTPPSRARPPRRSPRLPRARARRSAPRSPG